MIKHIVMWNLKEKALGNTREENAILIKDKLEALKSDILQIKNLEIGINDKNYAPKNYDVVLISEFENFEALNEYKVHPKHQEIGKFVGAVTETRAAVDYIV